MSSVGRDICPPFPSWEWSQLVSSALYHLGRQAAPVKFLHPLQWVQILFFFFFSWSAGMSPQETRTSRNALSSVSVCLRKSAISNSSPTIAERGRGQFTSFAGLTTCTQACLPPDAQVGKTPFRALSIWH